MDDDWEPAHAVRFGGDEGALTVLLGPGPAGRLVSREIHIECGSLVGQIKGVFDFDPAAVTEALRTLLTRANLTGQIRLTGAEHGEFRLNIDLDHGRGLLSAVFASAFGMRDGGGTLNLTTDQSYLREALDALSQISA